MRFKTIPNHLVPIPMPMPTRTRMEPILLLVSFLLFASTCNSSAAGSSKFPIPQFNAGLRSSSFSTSNRGDFLKEVLESSHHGSSKNPIKKLTSQDPDRQICKPTGQIKDACCDYETVEDINFSFFDQLASLVKTKYFRYYKVDLYKDCPFWIDNSLCMNRDCTVKKVDEAEIPASYRQLSSVSTTSSAEAEDSSSECSCRETDFCHWDDSSSEAVYVDLLENPERFTGYAGPSANRVWKSIYEENCFGAKGTYIEPPRSVHSGAGTGFVDLRALTGKGGAGGGMHLDSSSASSSSSTSNNNGNGFSTLNPVLTSNLNGLMSSLEAPIDPSSSEQCLEKRVFYRLISGLHASISIHICHDYLDPETSKWGPNLECFISKIAQHPERLQNVYFNYVLILRSLARAAEYKTPFLLEKGSEISSSSSSASSSSSENDRDTLKELEDLAKRARDCPPTFDEHTLFSGPDAENLRHEFKAHFRNVSSIMDCVGCDKCRLWGKLQVNGIATALKILFSFDDHGFDPDHNPAVLQRSELVALINTAHRFAESLRAVETFRGLYQDTLKEQSKEKEAEEETQKEAKESSDGKSAASSQSRSSSSSSSRSIEDEKEKGPPIPSSSSSSESDPQSKSRNEDSAQNSNSNSTLPNLFPLSGENFLANLKSALQAWKSCLTSSLPRVFQRKNFDSREL